MNEITVFDRQYRDGSFQGTTKVPLGFERRELRIQTRKNTARGGVDSVAMVVQLNEDDAGFTFAFGRGGDFFQTLQHEPKARCTETTVRRMHNLAISNLAGLIESARTHYVQEGDL